MLLRLMLVVLLVASLCALAGCGKKRGRVADYDDDRRSVRDYDDYDDDDDEYEYDDDDYDDDDYEEVRIERRHVCSEFGCPHHYYNGRRVVTLRTHRHGPGCGHVWNGRYWVRGPRRVIRTRHVCARGRCHDHFWNGSRIIRLSGHRHGPGCGHYWSGRNWLAGRGPIASPRGRGGVPVRHVCTQGGCYDHYWSGARLITIRGHRHGPGCGHFWNGKHWIAGRGRGVAPPRGGRRVIRRR